MRKTLLPLLTATTLAATGVATANETTVCTQHGNQRTIELVTGEKGCEVNYTKGSETKTLWSSPRAEYCAPHATEFVDKQKGWGFECSAKTASDSAAAAQ